MAGRARSRLNRATQMKTTDGKTYVLFENVFPATPSGRIELRSETLAKRWGDNALMPTWREERCTLSVDADFAGIGRHDFIDAGV